MKRYPREKHQGAAFEKRIAAVDMILYFNCEDVRKPYNLQDIYHRLYILKYHLGDPY